MDIQDMNQAGLSGEFLAENESAAPPESQDSIQAIGLTRSSNEDESAKAEKRANLVLAVLFMAGMGVVYFMSMHNEPATANPLDVTSKTIVEHAVAEFQVKPVVNPDIDQVNMTPAEIALEMTTGIAKRQVPLDELKDNPFMLARKKRLSKPLEIVRKTPGITALQRAKELKLEGTLLVNGVFQAIISDQPLSVGQEISGWRVHEISDGQVTLKYRTLTHVLRKKR
jgi:hypothetical protein